MEQHCFLQVVCLPNFSAENAINQAVDIRLRGNFPAEFFEATWSKEYEFPFLVNGSIIHATPAQLSHSAAEMSHLESESHVTRCHCAEGYMQ
ncbi:hypothetical protein WAI453_000963 [Rhynchosporium graminicola]